MGCHAMELPGYLGQVHAVRETWMNPATGIQHHLRHHCTVTSSIAANEHGHLAHPHSSQSNC